eukprot:TRINITY_DN322_c1_g1_i4.p1 TRINITY_DN322_c1_g1~~TRINITY_DN322_c1_g1_i4.p1  ORF type:complete len:276 (-),score=36.70 TRINITY_DN322_c1_g1_i4:177-1004(-)
MKKNTIMHPPWCVDLYCCHNDLCSSCSLMDGASVSCTTRDVDEAAKAVESFSLADSGSLYTSGSILIDSPEEVQLLIFRHLSTRDLLELSRVCISLNRLSKDASLWPLKWDNSMKKNTIMLSNNDMTATVMSHEGGCAVIKSTRGYKVGRNYWEVIVQHACWNAAMVFGVVDQRFSEKKSMISKTYLGSTRGGWGKAQHTVASKTRIGILMDFNRPKLRLVYYVDGKQVDVLQVFDVGEASTHLYPAVSMWFGGNTVTFVHSPVLTGTAPPRIIF